MEEIIRFVSLAQTDRFRITDLCEQFGISRKTGHKYLERYAAGGLKALAPRSHRPHSFPQRTSNDKRGHGLTIDSAFLNDRLFLPPASRNRRTN
jgi:hypothetical protein